MGCRAHVQTKHEIEYGGCHFNWAAGDVEEWLNEIFASTSERQWWWDADDRSVTWRIIEANLKTKTKTKKGTRT